MSELNRLSVDEFRKAQKSPVVIVLDNIRSQNNVGSVFRTADAFLIREICLCGITATPPHREIHKTALGATESVSWRYFKDTCDAISKLRSEGFKIIALEQTNVSITLDGFYPMPGEKLAFIFGNEVNGVGDQLLDMVDLCLEIPQSGTKHSINISVAVGIVLWDDLIKLKKVTNKCNPL